jgi:class 3 adenylate cyclase/acyl dehydratase
MAGFVAHLFTYTAVCAFLVAVWVLAGEGSWSDVSSMARAPSTIDGGFWPIWVILSWGTAVVIHLGAVLGFGIFGRRRRARRRDERDRRREEALAIAGRLADAGDAVVRGVRGRATAGAASPPAPAAASGEPSRRWVTVMFTDIVDSTQLTEALGDDAWSTLLRDHRELVRRCFVERGGREVSTAGDGFLARFNSAAEAVLCAVDIQQGLSERRGGGAVVPRLRIGIHAGEVVEDDGDLVGRVVNLASRVAAEAEPDEIMVTEPVADHLAGGLELEDRGVRSLKGVSRPRHLLSVRWLAGAGTAPAPVRVRHEVEARNLASDSENRIHADDEARRHGFRGGLVAGITSWAYLTRAALDSLGEPWLARGAMGVRFVQPVYDGERLVACADPIAFSGAAPVGETENSPENAPGMRVALALTDLAGEVRAEGWAELRDDPPVPPDPDSYAVAEPPGQRPPATPEVLDGLGALGVVRRGFHAERAAEFVDAIADDHPAYRNGAVAHPGWVIFDANQVLARNVALGPWIHLGSEVQHFDVVRDGDVVETRGRVGRLWERDGRRFVELDLLMVAARGDAPPRPVWHLTHTAIYDLGDPAA